MLRLCDNPTMLPDGIASVADLQGRWWVAHTRARAEKALARDLQGRGIGYFLPMRLFATYSGDRKRQVLKPIFTSYLFLCGNDQDRYVAMTTNHICQTLEVRDQETLVGELAAIDKALRGQADLVPCALPAAGTRCRVRAGPFAGIDGIVVQHLKGTRLILEVGILGQGASLEIDADLLDRIN
jgi:transcriptional antiterminator RfaH